ncbi:MAG: anhydro-N-acetylmuramic acid kinase [Pelagibacteraceae bacterium]
MKKDYISIGLMSGTSGDGVDASIISSDGYKKYTSIKNKYYEYNNEIFDEIHEIREKINCLNDIKKFSKEISSLERKITIFHAEVISDIEQKKIVNLIGFHGQTIYHNPSQGVSKQLGNGQLLSQLTKKNVVFNFRENDIKNGGQGAPLTPIFHNVLINQISKKYNFSSPVSILNIGGISNITFSRGKLNFNENEITAKDIGPGNCLIDEWMRKKTKKKYDKDGLLARKGKINIQIFNQAIENYYENKFKTSSFKNNEKILLSYDPKDFDLSFVRGLSLEDGLATLTAYTAKIIYSEISKEKTVKCLVCGGGRKNKFLMELIKKNVKNDNDINFDLIDLYNIDGDFVESQAFAYLAIRTFMSEPISFPKTTGCKKLKGCVGGEIIFFK